MRGSPLLHCLLGAIAFALFAIPLARLTVAQPELAAADHPPAGAPEIAGARHTNIRVRLAHQAQSLSLKLGARELVPTVPAPLPSLVEFEAELPLAKDGIELSLAARWPEGTPDTAITVELEPDELDRRLETRWSRGPVLNEILSFQW
jgi:hypothetical protein